MTMFLNVTLVCLDEPLINFGLWWEVPASAFNWTESLVLPLQSCESVFYYYEA